MADYIVSQFTVRIEDNGSDYRGCQQYLVSGNVTGEEFWTEPMRFALGAMGGDELEMAINALSMQPGDTDDEFFEDMSAEELAWRKRHADELSCIASDMEEGLWDVSPVEGDPCDLFACCEVIKDECSVPVMRELPESVELTRVHIKRLSYDAGYQVEECTAWGSTICEVIIAVCDWDSFKDYLAFHPQDEGYEPNDAVDGDPIEDVESGYVVRFRIESGTWSEYFGTLQESC